MRRQVLQGFLRGGAILVLVLTLGTLGCDKDKEVVRLKPVAAREQPNLPPAPNLTPVTEVLRYPEGAYSVEGLLQGGASLIGEEVEVKGYVAEKVVCDPNATTDCLLPPHAFLVDDLKRPNRKVLVVGSELSILPKLEKGSPATLAGQMANISPDGRFIRSRGLLVLPDLPPPPPSVDAGATAKPATE